MKQLFFIYFLSLLLSFKSEESVADDLRSRMERLNGGGGRARVWRARKYTADFHPYPCCDLSLLIEALGSACPTQSTLTPFPVISFTRIAKKKVILIRPSNLFNLFIESRVFTIECSVLG